MVFTAFSQTEMSPRQNMAAILRVTFKLFDTGLRLHEC
jgi:hypothetical protein